MHGTSVWRWVRLGGGAVIIGALLLHVGGDPFVDGLRHTTPQAAAIAMAITLLTTVCCAWRWSLVAGRLGVSLPLASAVAAYYRSQFVNATLPGGVLGDVHRAVRHGREVGHLGVGVRGVGWERAIGLVVYVAGATVVLLASSVLHVAIVVTVVGVGGVALAVVLANHPLLRGSGRWAWPFRFLATDARLILGAGGPRWEVVLASLVPAIGHTGIFVLAARAAGVSTPLAELVPVAMVVLVATVIPVNVAGWGPREATAAGALATVGVAADLGVTVAVGYGVLALIATLPGALLLLLPRRTVHAPAPPTPAALPGARTGTVAVTVGGAGRG